MNYYMPFTNVTPYATRALSTGGLLSRIFRNGINWGTILSNTQKTLNIINQTIPVIKQVKPVVNNAKTMFKIMNEFKKVDTPSNTLDKNSENIKKEAPIEVPEVKSSSNNNNPVFFI